MVGSAAVNSETFTVTTPSDHEIRMTRLFDAPRHLVFEAMTNRNTSSGGGAAWATATRSRSARSTCAPAALAFREPSPEGRSGVSRGISRDHAAEPARLHRNLRGLP